MNQPETTKPKKSTTVLYVWSIVLMAVPVGAILLLRYRWAMTVCSEGGCDTLRDIATILNPLATLLFVLGLALFIWNTVRYFARRH